MRTQDIKKVKTTSVGSVIEITNQPIQDPTIVNELITQEVISTLKETSTLIDLDYLFFEGRKSSNGLPGFAVYGRNSKVGSLRNIHVISIKHYSQNLAQITDIPERFFSGPEPVRSTLYYGIELSVNSPLLVDMLDPSWDASSPIKV